MTCPLTPPELAYIRSHSPISLTLPALSRFSRSCRSIPDSENFDPLVNPPWVIKETKQEAHIRICGPSGPINIRAQRFSNFLGTVPRNDILIYSDGSKLPDGNSGGGFVIFQYGLQVRSEAFPLEKFRDSYDAEAHTALQGLRAAITLPTARFANNLWLFLDNADVAGTILTSKPSKSSQSTFLSFFETAKIWKTRTRLPHIEEGQIHIR
ncbi:hypothetical protein K3495_g14868 [Podosphaera aphanis]|nr:hypothetical protein K3495_g14868 [Podosphaera aphanis]